jgi:hypothetical protein
VCICSVKRGGEIKREKKRGREGEERERVTEIFL